MLECKALEAVLQLILQWLQGKFGNYEMETLVRKIVAFFLLFFSVFGSDIWRHINHIKREKLSSGTEFLSTGFNCCNVLFSLVKNVIIVALSQFEATTTFYYH